MAPAKALKKQPRPQMFGFGKHMCPGKELAKLEIALFLKYFLSNYGYQLVEGQVRFIFAHVMADELWLRVSSASL